MNRSMCVAVGLLALALQSCSRSEPQQAQAPAEPTRAAASGAQATSDKEAPTTLEAEPAPAPAPAIEKKPKSERAGPSSLEQRERRPARDLLDEAPATLEQAERQLRAADRRLVELYGAELQAAEPLSKGDSRCAEGCRAFASLERAADAICRLTDEEHERCKRARKLVEKHQPRLERCHCGS